MQNVVCIINGMLPKMKTDEQNTPLNEMLICSICLTTDIGQRQVANPLAKPSDPV